MSGRSRRRWAALLVPVAALLLSLAAAGPGSLPGDVATARWIQRAPPPAAALARFAEWVAAAPALAVVSVLLSLGLAWRRRPALALFVLATLAIRGLNPLLKWALASPRPTPSVVRVSEQASGLGFPSGHAMGAMLLYGGIVLLTNAVSGPPLAKRLVRVIAGLVVIVVGFGRVSSGAHWPSDVLGGYLWGAALLLLLWRLLRVGDLTRRPVPDQTPNRTTGRAGLPPPPPGAPPARRRADRPAPTGVRRPPV